MWLKLAGLALLELGLVWILTRPITTHAVSHDLQQPLPPPPWYATDLGQAAITLVTLAALGFPLWLACRVVRTHRAKS